MKTSNYRNKNAKLAIYLSIFLHVIFILCLYLTVSFTKRNIKNFYQINTLHKKIIDSKEKNFFQKKIKINNQEQLIKFYYQTLKLPENKKNIIDKNFSNKIENKNQTLKVHDTQINQKKNIKNKLKNNFLSKKSTNIIDNTIENLNNTVHNNHVIYNQNYTLSSEIETYKEAIKQSIKNKLYDYNTFIGKVCELNLEIYSSGSIKSIRMISGDESLCYAAITSAKLARIPPAPNLEIYKIAKKITLRFSPE
ncbi:TolA family protein [Wigglesworthia glossinidia endosymbiont of Glossina morsitans morsitans (Yale colony)]|uniref:TolA family protein n=1 Tax=Wigglesworthia glossinidia endosymbiont of Glossina morsitans morsitans (Yale colony) TaxID=1142511 RepID=H6Q5Y8_WIGGL|nr:cell envelope integrity protein TolA [Wigglesworthia glossinidia]AFA41184.1 TolA family protein [Wigglesworthia glossinidia endosymbiont of Glossina morsitans morsitans (Yale colony)]